MQKNEQSLLLQPFRVCFPENYAFNRANKQKMTKQTMHISSEGIGEGHPDKVADYISDSILDACLAQDPQAHVACETLVKSNHVVVAGEITTSAVFDTNAVIRQAIREIGYTYPEMLFNADTVFITNLLTKQSGEINGAVVKEKEEASEVGAGDQGFFFGYACNETEQLMPASYLLAQKIAQKLATERKEGSVDWLRPDSKMLVTMRYEGLEPIEIENIVIATQHAESVSQKEIETFCREHVIPSVIPSKWLTANTKYFINSSGQFTYGGPEADTGLTGRKIIADTYGGWAHHGGGAFSGKDPSKVDRSGAYFCRWVAKNIVAAQLADRVEVRLAYTIGGTHPIHYDLTTYGTEHCDLDCLNKAVTEVFDGRVAAIIEQINLRRPIYRQSTQFGHFTKPNLPWEQTNRVEELKKRCG
jgi:S-adenosylmethionine synthetase